MQTTIKLSPISLTFSPCPYISWHIDASIDFPKCLLVLCNKKDIFVFKKTSQTTTNSKPGPRTLMWSRTLTCTHAHSQQLQQTQLPTQFDASSGGTWTSTSLPRVTAEACAGSCRDPLTGLASGLLAPPNPSGRLRLVDPAVDVGAEACRAGTPQLSRFATAPTPRSKQPLSHQCPAPGPHWTAVADPPSLWWQCSSIN